jgi:hypothetical protein
MNQRVSFKIPGTRKERDFTIYPPEGPKVVLQSSDAIILLDLETGKGVYNVNKGGAYFPHLSRALGAKPCDFGLELVAAVNKALPPAGTVVTLGGMVQVQY